jgi:phosphoribosylformylglycinamidine synthase
LALVGKFRPTLGGSEYLSVFHKLTQGIIPEIHLEEEKKLIEWILQNNQEGNLESAKDLSLGGLMVALVKIAFQAKLGIHVRNLPKSERLDELLFGETSSSILIGYKVANEEKLKQSLADSNLDFIEIGETIQEFKINLVQPSLEIHLNQAEIEWKKGLVEVFN